MKAAGVLRGRNERQFDAGAEAEDSVAGKLEVTVADRVMINAVLLSALYSGPGQIVQRQDKTQISCPFCETSFLAGSSGRPRCRSIWR